MNHEYDKANSCTKSSPLRVIPTFITLDELVLSVERAWSWRFEDTKDASI